MKGHDKVELTKFASAPDGSEAAYYRMAEFWFTNGEELQKTMSLPKGQAAAADIPNFATGAATFMIGETNS